MSFHDETPPTCWSSLELQENDCEPPLQQQQQENHTTTTSRDSTFLHNNDDSERQQQQTTMDSFDAVPFSYSDTSITLPASNITTPSHHHHQQQQHHQQRRRPRSRRGGGLSTQPPQFSADPLCGAGGITATSNATTTTTEDSLRSEDPQQQSLQDWLTASALHGTLDVLKLLGTTTGKLAAPPWHVMRTVILPQLWAGGVDFVRHASPPRLRDWFRLVSTAVQQFVRTLGQTESGHAVRNRLAVLGASVVECLSTDSVQQVCIDALACGIRWIECCRTPEFVAWQNQVTLTACAIIHAVADHAGSWTRLCHDGQQLVTSLVQWGADPETTAALAEIVAHLCYALEMEQQQQQQRRNRRPHSERHQYQTMHAARDTLPAQSDLTVEEAILSSLGWSSSTTTTTTATAGCVPENIVVKNQPQQQPQQYITSSSPMEAAATAAATARPPPARLEQMTTTPFDQDRDGAKSGATTTSTTRQSQPQQQTWHDDRTGNTTVDVEFLRGGIQQRATQLGRRQQQQQQLSCPEEESLNKDDQEDDDDVEDLYRVVTVENDTDDDDRTNNVKAAAVAATPNLRGSTLKEEEEEETTRRTTQRHRPTLRTSPSTNGTDVKRKTILFRDEIDPWFQQQKQSLPASSEPSAPHRSLPLEGESSSDHFQRLLHEILTQKRQAAAMEQQQQQQSRLTVSVGDGGDNKDEAPRGAVRRPDAPWNHPSRSRRKNLDWKRTTTPAMPRRIQQGVGQDSTKKLMYGVGGCIGLWILLVWGALGCYGLYTIWNRQVLPTLSRKHPPAAAAAEIVIRVVKEVVHVDADGRELGQLPSSPRVSIPAAEEYHQIAQCVANVYKNNNNK